MPTNSIIHISTTPDLKLQVLDHDDGPISDFYVSAAVLCRSGPFFRRLLDPHSFSEGRTVDEYQQRGQSEIPVIVLRSAGIFPEHEFNIKAMSRMLNILHGIDPELQYSTTPMALLATVSDYFSVADIVGNFVTNSVSPKRREDHASASNADEEPLWRKRIYTSMVLDIPGASISSYHMIVMGSPLWNSNGSQVGGSAAEEGPWSELPNGIEEELQFRRLSILKTLDGMQTYFINLYYERQCQLGYDNSRQCDYFQLGQLIRFLNRKQLATASGSLSGTMDGPATSQSIKNLIAALAQSPGYQIDSNHRNCGPRERMHTALDLLKYIFDQPDFIGLCLRCWKAHRNHYSWVKNPARGTWQFTGRETKYLQRSCAHQHDVLRVLFTADSHVWTLPGR